VHDGRQLLQAWIGHGHHTDIGVDGAEWIIFRGNLRAVSALNNVDFPTFGKPTFRSEWALSLSRPAVQPGHGAFRTLFEQQGYATAAVLTASRMRSGRQPNTAARRTDHRPSR
jgi:hypothetical protein